MMTGSVSSVRETSFGLNSRRPAFPSSSRAGRAALFSAVTGTARTPIRSRRAETRLSRYRGAACRPTRLSGRLNRRRIRRTSRIFAPIKRGLPEGSSIDEKAGAIPVERGAVVFRRVLQWGPGIVGIFSALALHFGIMSSSRRRTDSGSFRSA